MRPDAASFSPSNGTPGPFKAHTALVPREPDSFISGSVRNGSDSISMKSSNEHPRDMIVHESIKRLLTKIDALEMRCNALETTNEELKLEMGHLKAARPVTGHHRSMNGNLCGYDSSSNGSNATSATDLEVQSSVDIGELKANIEMISQILAGHDKDIRKQADQQQDLEKRFERKNQDQTSLRGLFGKLKKDFHSLEEKFEDMDIDRGRSLSKAGSSGSEAGSYPVREVQELQMNLTELSLKFERAYTELEGKCTALGTVVESAGVEPANREQQWPGAASNLHGASDQDVTDLKEWQRKVCRHAKNAQVIDEASTRDALYAMFYQLSELMGEDNEGYIMCKGPFETTDDEAFQLRDRVLRRLALFDQHSTALQEVQAKKGEVDY